MDVSLYLYVLPQPNDARGARSPGAHRGPLDDPWTALCVIARAPNPEATTEMDKLSHVDYTHEMAFIALDEDTGDMLGLVRLKDELDEETAEFAILVRSRLKGHGLGWLLMRHVIEYAKEKGLRRVYGDVLVENTTMLQMCGRHISDKPK